MKLTEKTKKYLAIGGGAVICIGLIAAISLQFGKAPAGEDTLPQKSPTSSEIVVDPSSLATRTDESGTEEKEETTTAEHGSGDRRRGVQPAGGYPAGADRPDGAEHPAGGHQAR